MNAYSKQNMQTATESFVILSRIKRQDTKHRSLFMKQKKGLSETLPSLLHFFVFWKG